MLNRKQYIEGDHKFRWTKIIIVLKTFLAVTSSDLLLKPENSLATDGNKTPVTLTCKSGLEYRLSWLIKVSSSSKTLPIFNGFRLSKNVTSYCNVINGQPGKYDLSLTATKIAARQYVCLEPGSMMQASAELIIIESDPECNVTTDGEYATFTCHIRFHGNWAPVMEWTIDDSSDVISEGVNETRDGESVTSRLIAPISHSHANLTNYSCTTKFRLVEKPSDTTADNIPLYNYTWKESNYIAESHKGAGDDKEKEETKAISAESNASKSAAFAALLAIPVIVIAVVTIFCIRKKTSKKKEKIPNDESDEFIKPQPTVIQFF